LTFGGIEFEESIRNMKKHRKSSNIRVKYDIILINDTHLAIIEAKNIVKIKDVLHLLEQKLSDFRTLYPEYNSHKILLGMGGMSFEEKAEEEAIKNGICLIKIVGDKVEFITEEIKYY